MATSKKKKEDEKKETKTPTKTFDVKEAIEALEISNMFKAGLGYYIESRKLEPKSQTEFDKILKDYTGMKLGE